MRTVLLLAMITVSEATIGVFVKLVDGRIPIATLNFYALAFAAAFLLVTVPRATGRPLDFPADNLRDTAIIGALIALQISVFNYAMTLAPIANVVIFWSVAPFFSFLFAWWFLNERPRRSYVVIFVLALVGIVIAKPLAGGHVAGNLVALADAAIYAAMITYMRYEGKTETDNDVPWQMIVAALVLAPSLVLAGPGEPLAALSFSLLGVELPVLLWAAGLGIVSTGAAYLGISMVLRRIRADTYTLVDVIVSPVIAATFGWLVFGEVPGVGMIVGGGILLASGGWLSREMARRRAQASAG
ncbi:MAG: EamA family transporter [Trueperaceae bacterium]|nr:EamA family transporter [Trueperaceae bacterium]